MKEERNSIKELIKKISNPQVQKILQESNIKANNKINDLEKQISEWFDTGMERASGWYQKQIQNWLLVISTILVIAVNGNTINIAKALWENDTLRSEVVSTVERTPQENSSHSDNTILQGDKRIEAKSLFPIGWENENFTCSFFWWLKA